MNLLPTPPDSWEKVAFRFAVFWDSILIVLFFVVRHLQFRQDWRYCYSALCSLEEAIRFFACLFGFPLFLTSLLFMRPRLRSLLHGIVGAVISLLSIGLTFVASNPRLR